MLPVVHVSSPLGLRARARLALPGVETVALTEPLHERDHRWLGSWTEAHPRVELWAHDLGASTLSDLEFSALLTSPKPAPARPGRRRRSDTPAAPARGPRRARRGPHGPHRLPPASPSSTISVCASSPGYLCWRAGGRPRARPQDLAPAVANENLRSMLLHGMPHAPLPADWRRASWLRTLTIDTMKGVRDLRPLTTAPALESVQLIAMQHLQPAELLPLREVPGLRSFWYRRGSDRRNRRAAELLGDLAPDQWR